MPVSLLSSHWARVTTERLKFGSMYGCQYHVYMSAERYFASGATIIV